jgi:hypothetical protein
MRVNVRGGTPSGNEESLCDSCRHSRITRGRTLDEELVLCDASPMRAVSITFRVKSCSGYTDDRCPSYMELLQQAWILQPGSSKRPAGFVRASDLRDAEYEQYMSALSARHPS